MPELRQDPISGAWVIIAPERAGRPDDFVRGGGARPQSACPFCGGHEHLTSTPLLEIPAEPGGAATWRIRVLPNKYPAVTMDADSARLAGEQRSPFFEVGIQKSFPSDVASADAKGTVPFLVPKNWDSPPALGQHEVVVESPEHLLSITELTAAQFADVVLVYRDRLLALSRDPRLVCGLVFKNMGAAGGATLEHLHSQIVALPMVPERLHAELNGAAQWRERHGGCAFCALIERELAAGARVVACGESFVALSPFAARTPYETWILPRRHESHFEQIHHKAAGELAVMLRQVAAAVEAASRPLPADHFVVPGARGAYNYVIHSAPFDTPSGDHYHWHVEVIPRMTRLAGFEWGTGWHINPVTPEGAALRLRKLIGCAEEKRSSAASLPIS